MRIVAVEEHFTFSDLLSQIDSATLKRERRPAAPRPLVVAGGKL
jgi:hypothetical protein